MDLTRQDFLPGSRLAAQQDRGRMACDELRTRQRGSHRCATRDDLAMMPEPIKISSQFAVLHMCTTRDLGDALDHVEVTRCGRDNLAERLAKFCTAEEFRQR